MAVENITAVEGKEIIELTRYLYGHIYGRYSEEMAEVNKIMSGALRLPGDEYVRKIREQEEEIAMLQKESKKKDEKLYERTEQLQEKDGQLQEKDEQLQEMTEQLQEKDEQIAALKRKLEALQKEQ